MTYTQAIRDAKERYKEAMDGAAADVVFICRTYGKERRAVCREIAGEDWNALDHRARRFEKTAGQTPDEARRAREKEAKGAQERHTKAVLKDPVRAAKVIASLPPEAQAEVASIADNAVRESRPLTPTAPGMNDLADSVKNSDRITRPLTHILNVLWKGSREMARVSSLRKTERDDLKEAADTLRVYADQFESWATESLDSEAFAQWLEAVDE